MATKQSSPEHVTEPTLPVTRGTPMKQVTLLDTEQVNMAVVLTENLLSFQESTI